LTTSRKPIFRAWFPVALWLGIIAIESSGLMSSNNTDGMLYSVLTAIFGHIDRHNFEVFHAVLRKCGHFTGYAILSLLFFRASVRTVSLAAATVAYKVFAVMSVAFTFVIASLDEWHQSLLPSRTGAFSDVLLDTSGAVAVQIVLLLIVRRRNSRLSRYASGIHSDSLQSSERGTCTSSRTAATTASPADK
jgi:VanZ family protein